MLILTIVFLSSINIQNRFEVPESEIPEIVKRTHYGERNPEHAGNWRGRNNRPGANYVAYTVVCCFNAFKIIPLNLKY